MFNKLLGLNRVNYLVRKSIIVIFIIGVLLVVTPISPALANTISKCGTISANETWTSDNVYLITCDVIINTGVIVTIQAGTVIKGDSYDDLITVDGILDVQGTASNPVVFTSYKDDMYGGDTNGDFGASTPSTSDWGKIVLNNPANTLDYMIIRYGYSGAVTVNANATIANNVFEYNSRGIVVSDASPSIHDNSITNSTSDGIYVDGGSPVIQNNSIQFNGDGVILRDSSATITGNIISNNTYYPLGRINSSSPTISGNTISNNGRQAIQVYGIININTTWENVQGLSLPYWVYSDLTINPTITLTLPAGTVIKGDSYDDFITVDGILDVQGTASNPVVFTSYKDDTYGGDTNGDFGASTPSTSDWGKIVLNNPANTLDYMIIRYGYSGAVTVNANATIANNVFEYNSRGIVVSDASPSIHDNSITNSTSDGIYVDGGSPTIQGNSIHNNRYGIYFYSGSPIISNNDIMGNTQYGAFNNSTTIIVAENDWWGDASGPYHPTTNPSGTGDQVSDYVDYSPWLIEPTQPALDTIPPANISNLTATTGSSSGAVNLSWTAPGDDGNVGTASTYIIRYNTAQINDDNWDVSTDISGEPLPATAGTQQYFSVTGLTAGQIYYFAIISLDEVSNVSDLSNSPSAQAADGGIQAYNISTIDNLVSLYPCGPLGSIVPFQPQPPLVDTDIYFSVSDSSQVESVYLVISGQNTASRTLSQLSSGTPGLYKWHLTEYDLMDSIYELFSLLIDMFICWGTQGTVCSVGMTLSPFELGTHGVETVFGNLDQIVLIDEEGYEYSTTTNQTIYTIHNRTLVNGWTCDDGEIFCFQPRCDATYAYGLSPIDLTLTDEEGRVTGFIESTVLLEIPNSFYSGPDVEDEFIVVYNPTGGDVYDLSVTGTDTGVYGLLMTNYRYEISNTTISFEEDIPITVDSVHTYVISIPFYQLLIPLAMR